MSGRLKDLSDSEKPADGQCSGSQPIHDVIIDL